MLPLLWHIGGVVAGHKDVLVFGFGFSCFRISMAGRRMDVHASKTRNEKWKALEVTLALATVVLPTQLIISSTHRSNMADTKDVKPGQKFPTREFD